MSEAEKAGKNQHNSMQLFRSEKASVKQLGRFQEYIKQLTRKFISVQGDKQNDSLHFIGKIVSIPSKTTYTPI